MASGHVRSRSALFTDLYDALATRRHAEHAHAMAESLLRADGGDVSLVSVVADFNRAVYHDAAAAALVTQAFDKHGVGPEAEVVARGVDDPAEWVATSPATFGWVHPRFR